jgi:hypothetical protein
VRSCCKQGNGDENGRKTPTNGARLWSIFLVLPHMFGYLEQKLLGRSRKSLVFLKSNFFSSEKFQVSAHVLPPIISWAISMKLLFFHAHLRMCQVSLKNIQK